MVDFTLTDEQKNLREMAHDFAEKEIRPVAWEYDKDGTWPEEIIKKAWEVGLMNTHIPEEYGGPGARLPRRLPDRGGALAGAAPASRPRSAATASRPRPVVLGGSEELKKEYLGMLTEDAQLASFCLTEPDAGSDVSGMRTTAVKQGRQVGHQRLEVLHHQRRLRQLVHGLREDRQGGRPPRHLRLHRPPRRRRRGGQEGGQDGPAGVEHGDRLLQRRRDPRRPPDRRGEQGLQARDDDARPHAPGRGGDGDRHRARRDGVRDRLLEGARPVRRADRDAPGDPVHDRRHGDRRRGRAPADLEVGRRCSTRASATRSSPRTRSASPPTPR